MNEFGQHVVLGTVHVVVPLEERDAWWDSPYRRRLRREAFPDGIPEALAPLRCGPVAQPAAARPETRLVGFVYVDVFDDDQLCTLCRRATPAASRAEALAHATPVDLDALLEAP